MLHARNMLTRNLLKNPIFVRFLTVAEAQRDWETKFKNNNIAEPNSSIVNILVHVLNLKSFDELPQHADTNLPPEKVDYLNRLCSCRLERMPVQYIIREWEYCNLPLKMTPPVFIPRPETEEITDIIFDNIKSFQSVFEVGCGSGAISLALLQRNPEIKCTAIDKSEYAIELTKENAHRLKLAERLSVYKCQLLGDGKLSEQIQLGEIDLIVSNPPYVPRDELQKLAPEILLYEDVDALDGGKDGLETIFSLLQFASQNLPQDGSLVMEVDSRHPLKLKKYLDSQPDLKLELINVFEDFCGKDRFVLVKKK